MSETRANLGASVVALLTIGASSCASVIGLDELHRGAGGDDGGAATSSGAGASGAGTGVAAGAPCSATRATAGVHVTTGDGAYCVDSAEVTNDEYAAFLATRPGGQSLPDACNGDNPDFRPKQGWPAPPSAGSAPVTWVDWCDAYAFCAWAGESLCRCVDGVDGLFDANGDVAEWEDSCTGDGNHDTCPTRGGAPDASSLACDARAQLPRDATSGTLGFRCCGS